MKDVKSVVLGAQKLMREYGYKLSVDGELGDETIETFKQVLIDTNRERVKLPGQQRPLPWISEAKKWIGLKEIVGRMHNKRILRWSRALGAWWNDDETPWCGTFVAWCLRESERPIPKHWYRAKAYTTYGTKLANPAWGCIGVKGRERGGHVFFVVGQTKNGDIVGHGGNQSNAVNLRVFKRSDILAYVWPDKEGGLPSKPFTSRYELPLYTDDLLLSTAES